MDKYEYKVRADEIKDLIAQGDYIQAAEIADTIDWRRVKSVMMLCTISDLYKINRRYEDARDMLLLAYERRPGGRTICYSLCELSIKMEEYVQAVEYYKEYVQVAPKDSGRYILQYKLYEAQDVSLEERIEVLEELKKRDYREKWAYELAYLYHRVGLATRCVEECDEMILWFGDGKYVIKAMELKMLHQPLSPEQQEKYDSRFGTGAAPYTAPQPEVQAEAAPRQAEVRYVPDQTESDPSMGDTKIYTPVNMEQLAGGMAGDVLAGGMPTENSAYAAAPAEASTEDEMDIHVKTVDVGQYNTMNLQAEIAAGLREVLGEDSQGITNDPITNAIVAPMMEPDTANMGYQQTGEASESSEVFFGETAEIGDLGLTTMLPVQGVPEDTAEIVMEQMRLEEIGADPEEASTEEIPKEMADVLSQGADGQISLVVPETETVEKQITGQMNIVDILAEWERMKLENEEKRKEEVRKHVLQQTGTMFTEFEAAVRDGLLEQLESGKIESVAEAEQATVAAMNSLGIVEGIEEIAKEQFPEDFIETFVDDEYDEEFDEDAEKGPEIEELEIQDLTEQEPSEGEVPAEDAIEEEIAEEESVEEAPAQEETVEEESAEEESEETVEETAEEATAEESVEEAADQATEETATEEIVEEAPATEAAEESKEEASEETAEAAEVPATEESSEEVPTEKAEETVEETVEKAEAEEPAAEKAAEEAPAKEAETITAENATEKSEEEESEEDEALKEKLLNNTTPVPEVQDLNPEEDRPAVERDKAKIRALTRDEKELYATFIQSKSSREQLVQALDNISLAAYTGNVIITGEEGMDTLTLAKNMVREVQSSDSNFSGKVAKISGSALNNRDAAAIVRDLENGALIIQKAADMTSKTAAVLYKALQQETMGIVVVIEDTKRAMNHFLSEHVNLSKCFTARMDVEALSNDTLVAFGRQYAREMEYAIDEMGMLALHTRIADMQTSDHVVTVVEVKKIVDEAIFNANKKTVGHFFDVLLAKRYDDEDMIVLGEKDFT